MENKERLTLNLTPDMRKGIKMLFKGQRINQAFEDMLRKYINDQLQETSETIKTYDETLKEFKSRNVDQKVIGMMQEKLILNLAQNNFYKEIKGMCFPDKE